MRVLALAALAAVAAAAPALPNPADVLSDLAAADTYFQAHNDMGDCGWTRGTYYAGLMAHYAVSKNASLVDYATTWANNHSWTCGGPGASALNCNSFACGMAYSSLYEIAPDNYKLALAVTLDQAIATYKGYDWWWVDCQFMGLGTSFHYGALLSDSRIWDMAYDQYSNITFGGANASQPALWDTQAQLYYRDHTYINHNDTNGKKVFWARGVGWISAALAQALTFLPAEHPYAAEFRNRLTLLAGSLKPLQGSDGMWRASLLDAAIYSNPETTGTALFTYAIAWGINNGVLDAATYTPVVAAAWNGLSTIALQPSGLVGYCQPPDGQPHPATPTDTSDFCVGQFLLAGSEVYKLAGGKL